MLTARLPRRSAALSAARALLRSSASPAAEAPPRTGDHVYPETMRPLPDPEDAYRKERRIGLVDDQPPRGQGKAPAARWYERGRGSGRRSAADAAQAGRDDTGDAASGPGDQSATVSGIVARGCEAAAAAAAAARRPKAV